MNRRRDRQGNLHRLPKSQVHGTSSISQPIDLRKELRSIRISDLVVAVGAASACFWLVIAVIYQMVQARWPHSFHIQSGAFALAVIVLYGGLMNLKLSPLSRKFDEWCREYMACNRGRSLARVGVEVLSILMDGVGIFYSLLYIYSLQAKAESELSHTDRKIMESYESAPAWYTSFGLAASAAGTVCILRLGFVAAAWFALFSIAISLSPLILCSNRTIQRARHGLLGPLIPAR